MKTKKPIDYQHHCRTVNSVIEEITRIFAHPDWKIKKFRVEGITPVGGTINLSFDRKDLPVSSSDTT